MKIFAKPMSYSKLSDIDYGTVFDINGEFYMKLNYDTNAPEKKVVHLGSGVVSNVSDDATVLIVNGYFVKDFEA